MINGIDCPTEHIAHHEAGHAVTWALLGCTPGIDFVDIRPPHPRTQPSRVGEDNRTLGQRLLIAAAGTIADQAARNLSMDDSAVLCLLTGAGGQVFTVTGPDGHVERIPRAPAVAEGEDLHDMAAIMATDGWPDAEIIRTWRDCERYVAAIMPAVKAVAAKLLIRGSLGPVAVARIAREALNGSQPSLPGWVSWDLAGWDAWVADTMPWVLEGAVEP